MKLSVSPRFERRHLNDLFEIDLNSFGEYPNEKFVSHAFQNPWAYTIVERDGKAVGYGLILPVTSFAHEAVKMGEMDEDEVLKHTKTPENCQAFYIAAMGCAKDARLHETSRLTGYTMGQVLRSKIPVFAVAVSKAGERAAREVGMRQKPFQGAAFRGLQGYKPIFFEKKLAF